MKKFKVISFFVIFLALTSTEKSFGIRGTIMEAELTQDEGFRRAYAATIIPKEPPRTATRISELFLAEEHRPRITAALEKDLPMQIAFRFIVSRPHRSTFSKFCDSTFPAICKSVYGNGKTREETQKFLETEYAEQLPLRGTIILPTELQLAAFLSMQKFESVLLPYRSPREIELDLEIQITAKESAYLSYRSYAECDLLSMRQSVLQKTLALVSLEEAIANRMLDQEEFRMRRAEVVDSLATARQKLHQKETEHIPEDAARIVKSQKEIERLKRILDAQRTRMSIKAPEAASADAAAAGAAS